MFDIVVISYGIVIFLLSWFNPIPYGRFCNTIPKILELPNILSWVLCNLPALVVIGYQLFIVRSKGLGLALNIFLFIHFFWRGLISQLFIFLIQSTPDVKTVSIPVFLVLGSYNAFVGLAWIQLCDELRYDVSPVDIIFIVGAGVSLLLNAFYDVFVNYHRNDDDLIISVEGLGYYITEVNLEKYFKLLHVVGITSPNYFFEMIEWMFIAILVWERGALLYLISTTLILWVRAYNISLWYQENK